MHTAPNHIRPQLEQLLSDRRSPEARQLYMTLARYIDKRVQRTARHRYPDVLGTIDIEEIVGDVVLQLMSGALARFRGHTIGELLAFVRMICDRTVGHTARRRIRERDTLAGEARDVVAAWTSSSPQPDQVIRLVPDTPLTDADADYLQTLLDVGSQAALARHHGVSRAAVTQRLHRIRDRIAAMSPDAQQSTRAWVEAVALKTAHQKAAEPA
jgi:DNA-directed RNA polymerase specialized sigma24 family protein